MLYYGTRLSENLSRREPEGYLLCLNVPVARTGAQEYLPEELGLPPSSPGRPPGPVTVYRPEEEVFSPACVASFEGMPVTNDHPPDGVSLENIRFLQKGHAHNLRRGIGAESDLLLADLIITDAALIHAILEEGKREISCGYTYELSEENGRYVQRRIRGNHVAVVDAGRAGPRVRIHDAEPASTVPVSSSHDCSAERRTKTMKKSLSRVLARMAKDGDAETVAEFIEEMLETAPEESPAAEAAAPAEDPAAIAAAAAADPTAVVETPEGATVVVDEDILEGILSRLDTLISLLGGAAAPAADEDPEEEIAEAVEEVLEAAEEAAPDHADIPVDPDALAAEVAEIIGEIAEPAGEILTPEGDCDDPERSAAADAIRAALRVVRPALAGLPKAQRARACADIAARIRATARDRRSPVRPKTPGTYAALARASARDRRSADPAALGKRIMQARNINARRG